MTTTLGRRVARLEEARTATALADFRVAFAAWLARDKPEDHGVQGEALLAARSPAERDEAQRGAEALFTLAEPAAPPGRLAAAAAVFAGAPDLPLPPHAPPYRIIEALVAHFGTVVEAGGGQEE